MQRNLLAAAIVATLVSGLALAYAGHGWKHPLQTGHDPAATTASSTSMNNLAITTAAARPKPSPSPLPLQLDIEIPRYNKMKDPMLPLLASSGAMITLRANATREPLGIMSFTRGTRYPGTNGSGGLSGGAIVFSDATGCTALGTEAPACILDPASSIVALSFVPGRDTSALEDFTGDPALAERLSDSTQSGPPRFHAFSQTRGNYEHDAPPNTGLVSEVVDGVEHTRDIADGYGFGADDDLPGLVLLSDAGVGLVLDADFNPPLVAARHNLAGLVDTVGYTLRSSLGFTEVYANLQVPSGLLAPLLLADSCTNSTSTTKCESGTGTQYRVDGNPDVLFAAGSDPLAVYRSLFAERTFEIRAFLVKGRAPHRLEDENRDGAVNAADATIAGYTLLSNEVRLRFRQIWQDNQCVEPQIIPFDFPDNGHPQGDGFSMLPDGCGAGPGQITQVPD